jgi:hypothetical protein
MNSKSSSTQLATDEAPKTLATAPKLAKFKMRTSHAGTNAALASPVLLSRISGSGTFTGFGDLQTPDLYVRLRADYKDAYNWSFEVAGQPCSIRAGVSEAMFDSVMEFVVKARRATAMLEGVLPLVEGLERGALLQQLLNVRVILPANLARDPRQLRRFRRREIKGLSDDTHFVVATPPSLAMRAIALHNEVMNRNARALNNQDPWVPVSWQGYDAPEPGDAYTAKDAEELAAAYSSVMETASAVDEVDGLFYILNAVTPRPPTAEDQTPGMTAWCRLDGHDHKKEIVLLRIELVAGRMVVYMHRPEVRIGGRDGEVFQHAETKGTYSSGKPRLVYTNLMGLPPLANGNRHLTGKFLPRKDILSAAPELQQWLVGQNAEELAAIQQWTAVPAAVRKEWNEVREVYIRTGRLEARGREMFEEFHAQAYMAFIQRQFLLDQKSLREFQAAAQEAVMALEGAAEAEPEAAPQAEPEVAPQAEPEAAPQAEPEVAPLVAGIVDGSQPVGAVIAGLNQADDEMTAQERKEMEEDLRMAAAEAV